MNLSNFESYIDRTIFARGYDYYENDHVISVEETDNNIYEAEVEGTELYTVEVKLDDETNIIDTQCDCPYDMGEYCKHQAAVFLALRDIKNKGSVSTSHLPQSSQNPDPVPKHPVSSKGNARGIEKILSERTKDELVEFLLDIASEYEEIRQRIELDYDDANDVDEIMKSTELIQTFIRNNSDRHGFVAYGDADEAVRGADLVLEKARDAFKHNKPLHALDLTLCVIHEMMDLVDSCDDSDGVVDGTITESFGFINEMIEDGGLSAVDKESFLINSLRKHPISGMTDGLIGG